MSERARPAHDFLAEVVLPHDGDQCLIWPHRRVDGYGYIRVGHRPNRKSVSVSRLICEIKHGAPPTPKHEAAHSCGKGHLGCVNPRHLSWKTPAENQADRIVHGTSNIGSGNGSAKLDEEKVLAISKALSEGVSADDLSSMYGVSRGAIFNIKSGYSWSHVTGRVHNG